MPTWKKRLVFCYLCINLAWAIGSRLTGQSISFTQYSTKNGLTSNAVNDFVQDRQGFLWVATANGLNRFDGNQFRQYKFYQDDSCSISDNYTNCLLIDQQGTLWAGTKSGLNHYLAQTDCFEHFSPKGISQMSANQFEIFCMVEDRDGHLWLGVADGMFQFNRQSGTFRFWPLPPEARLPDKGATYVMGLAATAGGLFVSSFGLGIWYFNIQTETFSAAVIDPMKNVKKGYIRHDLYTESNGQIWSLSDHDLFRYDAEANKFRLMLSNYSEQFTSFFRDREGKFIIGMHGKGIAYYDQAFRLQSLHLVNPEQSSPDANYVYNIFQDRSGEIWLGLAWGGIFKYDPKPNPFESFQRFRAGKPDGFPKDIGGLCERRNGQIWTASLAEGCHVYDPATNRFTSLRDLKKYPKPMRAKNILRVFEDHKQRIWMGAWGQGLMVYDEKTGDFYQFPDPVENHLTNAGKTISSIGQLADGRICAGSLAGIILITEDSLQPDFSKRFKQELYPELGGNLMEYVICLMNDHTGKLWIGGRGLVCMDPQSGAVQVFRTEVRDQRTLSNNRIGSLYEDSKHRLWVGTIGGGLNLWLPDEQRFIKFRQKDGLPSDVISGIQEDRHGKLWLFTGLGLCKFDPETRTFNSFNRSDGMPCERFAFFSSGKSRHSGKFYAGAQDGFVMFHPDSVKGGNYVPPVVISNLKKYTRLGDQIVAVEVKGIAYTKRLALRYYENSLIFEFAALNYRQSFKNQYAYRLEGLEDQWIYLGSNRTVTFAGLPPGHYVLHVKASNNDGLWNEQGVRLEIEIYPPWWQTYWAWAIYLMAAFALIFSLFRLQINRNAARAEALRFKSLNDAKSEFLNTVSHELRTPLTSIMGFSKLIKKRLEDRIIPQLDLNDPKNQRTTDQILSNLNIVVVESERLSVMVNDVLDLSKIESGKIEWQETTIHMDQIVERSIQTTENLFEQKNLLLRYETAGTVPSTVGDPDRLLQVMVNLLSNAVKFTEKGRVVCRIGINNDDHLLISVSDTGPGIPIEYQDQIFEKFRQVGSDTLTEKPKGTGLGLSICREIVEHHGGRIWVKSEPGQGSTFYFTLPVRKTTAA